MGERSSGVAKIFAHQRKEGDLHLAKKVAVVYKALFLADELVTMGRELSAPRRGR